MFLKPPGGAQHQYANTPPPYLEFPGSTIRFVCSYQALQCHLSAADVLLRYPEIVQEERKILPSTPLRDSDI